MWARDAVVEVVLVARGAVLARWPLHVNRVDLSVIDVLGRLQLSAHRIGASIELEGTAEQLAELGELIAFAGLRDVLPISLTGHEGPG